MASTTPFFSIVIPTRNRPDTLYYSLLTCLNLDHDSYEVIVSDNGDEFLAKPVVDKINDSRIRYVRPEQALSMTKNFEFGVDHARGEYIIVFGDDDGMMPYGLLELEQTIAEQDSPDAITWDQIYYNWPNMVVPENRNILTIPVSNHTGWIDSKMMAADQVTFRKNFAFLPMLYHSAIHRRVLDKLKERTGSVFKSRSPDVYTGLAICAITDKYFFKALPCTITGSSGKSTGAAHLFTYHKNAVAADYKRLNDASETFPHSTVPDLPTLPTCIGECFAYAKDYFNTPDELGPIDQDIRKVITFAIRALLETQSSDREDAQAIIRSVLVNHHPDKLDWFDNEIVPAWDVIKLRHPMHNTRSLLADNTIAVDAKEEFGVTNVRDAAELATAILHECLVTAQQNSESADVDKSTAGATKPKSSIDDLPTPAKSASTDLHAQLAANLSTSANA